MGVIPLGGVTDVGVIERVLPRRRDGSREGRVSEVVSSSDGDRASFSPAILVSRNEEGSFQIFDREVSKAFLEQGVAAMEHGNQEGGVATLRRAIDADPSNPEPFLVLAALFENEGNLKRATQALMGAFALDPSDTEVLDQIRRLSDQLASSSGQAEDTNSSSPAE